MTQPEQAETKSHLPYSKGLGNVLKLGREDARRLNHEYLFPELFFLGLMQDEDVLDTLDQLRIDPARIKINIEIVEELTGFVSRHNKGSLDIISVSPHIEKILELANIEANQTNSRKVNPIHVLIGGILVEGPSDEGIHLGGTLGMVGITKENIPALRKIAKELDLRTAA